METLKRLEGREKYKDDIKGLQYVALDILKVFNDICRKNKIEYWLDGGSLLGAIRHKGFIPWDDDIDVCIKASDMKKLKNILEKELPYYLYVTDDEFFDGKPLNFLKIRDKYSIAAESKIKKLGIWIDIFPMNEVKEKKIVNFLLRKIPIDIITDKDNYLKKYIKIILWKILKKFGIESKKELAKNVCRKIMTKQNEGDGYIYTFGEMWWHIYKKDWIFPLKEIEFEGYNFFCPNDWHSYLTSYYNDYMKLPPEDQRVAHSKIIKLCEADMSVDISLRWEDRRDHFKQLD